MLQTVIEKYLKRGEKLYACFVDLKKAFDSVWRQGLFQKLHEIGLGPKTINLISDMYRNTYTSLIYHNKILPKIPTTKGVKQGDNLSPLLFNIFINDLPTIIGNGNTHPVKLDGVDINSMLWADDIVIVSETSEGLQRCLNNLSNYCKEWKLEINLKKTKTIIFNKIGKNIKSVKFQLNSVNIENVIEYPYLGFTITASGKFHMGIQKLIDKGQRAWFSILQILHKSKYKNIETYITLFDNIIKPIILYACEIWGITKNNGNIDGLGKSVIERFHFKICKQIIGVNRKASNIAVLAELGRYPLYIEIQERMIKYLLRFRIIQKDRLLFKAYQEQIKNLDENENWLNNTKNILDRNGFSYVFINQIKSGSIIGENNIKETSKRIKNRSKDIFEQNILHHIKSKSESNEGKLIFYAS